MTNRKRRNIVRRLPALLMAVLVLVGAAVPALAAEQVTSTGTFWTHLAQKSPDWIGTVIGGLYASACPTSPDNLHHGKVLREGSQRGQYWAWCDYCSKEFQVHDRDLDDAYNSKVTNIQNNYGTTAVGTNGILYPLTPFIAKSPAKIVSSSYCSADQGLSSFVYKVSASYDDFTHYFNPLDLTSIVTSPGYLSLIAEYYCPGYQFESSHDSDPPCAQVHFTERKPLAVYSCVKTPIPVVPPVTNLPSVSSFVFMARGRMLTAGTFVTFQFRAWLCFQPYEYDVNNFTQNIGGENSRVGKFSGNFGYYGDNGQLITADNVQIVNEGDKTIYNPATGTTSPVKDWTYDYSNRSYDLTLDTGDKVNVTYGDEHVTIKQGDTIYNIYYVVEPTTPDPTPTPSAAPEPTPTSVPTPAPSGNPQPPPTDDPGSGEGGGSLWEKLWDAILSFIKLIGNIIGGLLTAILTFFTGILEKVVGLIDLFGTFGEIVSSLYTWLPTELQTLIAGALAISLALAVISLFRK